MKENRFQAKLIEELKLIFPDCIVLKNDSNYIQGFPDLTVLYGELWAVLECKKPIRTISTESRILSRSM